MVEHRTASIVVIRTGRLLAAAAVMLALLLCPPALRAQSYEELDSPPPPTRELFPKSLEEIWADQGLVELDPDSDPNYTWGIIHGYRFVSPSDKQPAYFLTADYLILDREGTRHVDYISLGVGPARIALSTESHDDFDYAGGLRMTGGAMLNDVVMVSATYFGFHHWSEECTVTDIQPNGIGAQGNLFSPFGGFGVPPIPGVDFNHHAEIAFASELDSAEVNLYRTSPLRCGVLEGAVSSGFRYFRLSERFHYLTRSQAPVPLGTVVSDQISTHNHLFGGQIGVLLDYWITPRWWAECEVKTGLYHNSARMRNVFAQASGPVLNVNDDRVSNGRAAFLGELMASCNVRVTCDLVVRVGYQMLWVDGVAVAEENFSSNFSVQSQGTPKINTNGTMLFHGPHLGMSLTW